MSMPALVPAPVQVSLLEDAPVALTDDTSVTVVINDDASRDDGRELSDSDALLAPLRRRTGLPLPLSAHGRAKTREEQDSAPLTSEQAATDIHLFVDTNADLLEGADAYRIGIEPGSITVTARTNSGLAWAVATLAQLGDVSQSGTVTLPSGTIEDAPRFSWRGFSLDVARSFLSVAEVKRIVDLLQEYKFNVLHLHLTDDQGWRLQIPGRERLTEVSAATASDGGTSGFYTVEEFADLQDYAGRRGVALVPEIDLPGHTNAATHAYGELKPDGQSTPVYGGSKVGFSMLHPDVEATAPFLRDVLGSAAQQTRGDFLHFGGDEPLEMDPADYSQLVGQIEQMVRDTGKRPVAWQEAAAADLPSDVIYQFWDWRLPSADLEKAARNGAQLIMSPADRIYLDMKYDDSTPMGQDWAGLVELQDSYDWEPAERIPNIPEDVIIGVEGAIWTETIHCFDDLTYMILPRLAAIAELAWSSQDNRGWKSFRDRVAPHGSRWTDQGLSWHRSPGVDWA